MQVLGPQVLELVLLPIIVQALQKGIGGRGHGSTDSDQTRVSHEHGKTSVLPLKEVICLHNVTILSVHVKGYENAVVGGVHLQNA